MGLLDEIRAVMGEVVDAVAEAAQTTTSQAKEVAGDLADEVRQGVEAAGPHLRRGIGAAAFAADWVVRESRRQAQMIAAEFRAAAEAAAEEEDAAHEPWRTPQPDFTASAEPPEYEERQLTEAEEVWARRVFRDTLPYGITYLSNQLGLHGKPYTVPHPTHLGAFILHVGPDVYERPFDHTNKVAGQRGDAVFVHGLAHVWQGVHRWRPLDYAVRTLSSPFVPGADTYRYEAGKEWNEYDADQQASIIRDWYLSGMPPGGALFPYIRDHVWPAVTVETE
jgi:hypothetical protein